VQQLGIQQGGSSEIVKSNPAEGVWLGVKETAFIVERTFDYIGGMFTGREDADQLRGVIGIARCSGRSATVGSAALLRRTALRSVSIGLRDLFPVPMRDGGQRLDYAVGAVRGRPRGGEAQGFGFKIGLALVMTLMVFATWNDLPR